MNIVTWSRNPSRKNDMDVLLSETTAWEETNPYWRSGVFTWQNEPTLVIVWDGQLHAGALKAEALNALERYVKLRLDASTHKLLLAISSSGADIHEPFESLVALNSWIESIIAIQARQEIEIEGVILPPRGVYGGASIMMVSLCDTLWCDSPDDIHLLGTH